MINQAHFKDVLLKLEGINDLLACVAMDDPALFVLQDNLNGCVKELYSIVESEE